MNKLLLLTIAIVILPSLCTGEKSLEKERTAIYIEALQITGDKEKLKAVLESEIAAETDTLRLAEFVKVAQNEGFFHLAETGYHKILGHDPDNELVHKQLGEINYFRSEYREAVRYFENYLKYDQSGYLTVFRHGDSHYNLKDYEPADRSLEKALNIISKIAGPTLRDRDTEAQILFKLQRVEESFHLYESLLQEHPSTLDLRMNYLDLLLNVRDYDKAEDQLFLLSDIEQQVSENPRGEMFIDNYYDKTLGSELLIRHGLIRTRYFAMTHKLHKAFSVIKTLKSENPRNPQILSAESQLFLQMSDSIGGLQQAVKAKELDPFNGYYRLRAREIWNDKKSFVAAHSSYRMTDTTDEWRSRVMVEQKLNNRSRIGVKVERSELSGDDIINPDGIVQSSDKSNTRTELYAETILANSDKLKLSLYSAAGSDENDTIGAGTEYTAYDYHGFTQLGLEYHKPYWDTTEGLAFGANRDRIRLTRALNYFKRLDITGSVGYNRYNLDDMDDTSRSYTYNLIITYHLIETELQRQLLGRDSAVLLTYAIDGEEVLDITEKTNAAGTEYEPLPISDRQVHTFAPLIRKEFWQKYTFEGMFGYSVDIIGDLGGPFLNTYLKYEPNENVELELNASHTITTDEATTIGIGIKWKY